MATYRKRPVVSRKLAPLEHVRSLYEGAGSTGAKRRSFQKKDLIEAVRRMSPTRSTPSLSHSQPLPRKSSSAASLPDDSKVSGADREVLLLEEGVNANARRFNVLKMQADTKQKELDHLLDTLAELKQETDALEALANDQTPEAIHIRALDAQVREVEQEISQRLQYRRQLDHMQGRLRHNQLAFDAHIRSMEDALDASKREFDEVRSLMRQLEAGRSQAAAELQTCQTQLAVERRERDRQLAERRKEAATAQRMEEWRKQREAMRAELAAELRGDLSKEEEARLLAQLREKQNQTEELRRRSRNKTKEALTLEDAFIKIRQATGVTSLDEMVEKFMGQDATRDALEAEKAQVEQALAAVRDQRMRLQAEFDDLKASGMGGTELNRELYDKLDAKINKAKSALKMNKATSERLESVLVAVRQGATGLAQRLTPFAHLVSAAEELELPHTGVESVDVLHKCEFSLCKMLAELSGRASPAKPAPPASASKAAAAATAAAQPAAGAAGAAQGGAGAWGGAGGEEELLHANNVRVTSVRMAAVLEAVVHRPTTPASAESSVSKRDDGSVEEAEARTVYSDSDSGARTDTRRSGRREATGAAGATGDPMADRDAIKRRARKRFAAEQRRRETAARRAAEENGDVAHGGRGKGPASPSGPGGKRAVTSAAGSRA